MLTLTLADPHCVYKEILYAILRMNPKARNLCLMTKLTLKDLLTLKDPHNAKLDPKRLLRHEKTKC